VRVVPVTTAREMRDAVMREREGCHAIFMVAAVSDYAPRASALKLKKTGGPLTLVLEEGPDILAELGATKGSEILVGFAAETDDVMENAAAKLAGKRADFIVANDVLRSRARDRLGPQRGDDPRSGRCGARRPRRIEARDRRGDPRPHAMSDFRAGSPIWARSGSRISGSRGRPECWRRRPRLPPPRRRSSRSARTSATAGGAGSARSARTSCSGWETPAPVSCSSARGPAPDEDLKGEPFVGRAGKKLDEMIQSIGLTRDQVYIANVVKCRPPDNRTPEPDEIATCSPYLFRQIEAIAPDVIVALGRPRPRRSSARRRGSRSSAGNWGRFRGIPVMPTFHPAYLLRAYTVENRRLVYEDLKAARARMTSTDA
jgi:DNA polymerase